MNFPKGKGFDLVCGLVITVVLDDFVRLTGTFLGEIREKHHHKRCDEFHEFILIQLTCPVCEKNGPEIPEGTFCSINVDKIQFIFPGRCHNKKLDKCDDTCNDTCTCTCDDTCDDKWDDDEYHNKCDDDKW